MDPTPQQPGGDARTAAAVAVAPDQQTADLLAKHAAGQPLTQSEYGKVGAFASKLKRFFVGKSDAPAAGPAHAGPTATPTEATPGGVAVDPVAAALCQRTTSSVLKRIDAVTQRVIDKHARAAGATGETLDRLRAAAALPAPDRELIAELSPDILAEAGIDPRKYPLIVAGSILGLHATTLWLAVDDLRQMRKEREATERKPQPQPEKEKEKSQ